MQPSAMVLSFSKSWRDRNVPPIGLTAYFGSLTKA
jgi:hypothetical protein